MDKPALFLAETAPEALLERAPLRAVIVPRLARTGVATVRPASG